MRICREASIGAKRNLEDFFFCSLSQSFGPEIPMEKALAGSGRASEGARVRNESKKASLREISNSMR